MRSSINCTTTHLQVINMSLMVTTSLIKTARLGLPTCLLEKIRDFLRQEIWVLRGTYRTFAQRFLEEPSDSLPLSGSIHRAVANLLSIKYSLYPEIEMDIVISL